ncbi:MAG: NAD-dependent epimerase [Planctomycetales bacterium]|nr:NAD-dependent epimerase [Planctomycetales bacterium]
MASYLVTGAAGFIGFHVCQRMLAAGDTVIGIDNLNPYYDPELKRTRLRRLLASDRFEFDELDVNDTVRVTRWIERHEPQAVLHLAAQVGVRYSVTNPAAYLQANLAGFLSILEASRGRVEHLVYASSSSVYGANTRSPFSEHHHVDHPVSLYGATKRANELMAHSYSHLYQLPTTGLRFFTVYGPWGRPDMALFAFTRAILAGKPIDVYNHGRMKRDFTYVDDIVEGVYRTLRQPPRPDSHWDSSSPDPATSSAPFRIFNIGNNQPIELGRFIDVLERCLGRPAQRNLLPLQPGDVIETCANVDDLAATVGFRPSTPIEVGIERFVAWYRDYYGKDA